MFSGVVAFQSKVETLSRKDGLLTVALTRPKNFRVKTGQSIAVNGVCSTLVGASREHIVFEYMPETLRKTTLGTLRRGELVNLEPSLTLRQALNGHFVTGHVDAVGTVQSIAQDGRAKIFHIRIPEKYTRYIATRGSVTVEGVGLTVVGKKRQPAGVAPTTEGRTRREFTVSVTPYTLRHTNLRAKRVNARVNVEYDIIAKYLNEIVRARAEQERKPGALRRHRRKPL